MCIFDYYLLQKLCKIRNRKLKVVTITVIILNINMSGTQKKNQAGKED